MSSIPESVQKAIVSLFDVADFAYSDWDGNEIGLDEAEYGYANGCGPVDPVSGVIMQNFDDVDVRVDVLSMAKLNRLAEAMADLHRELTLDGVYVSGEACEVEK